MSIEQKLESIQTSVDRTEQLLRQLFTRELIEPQLTLEEAAEKLRLHHNTVLRYVKEGKIKSLKDGKRRYFLPSHIKDYRKSIEDHQADFS